MRNVEWHVPLNRQPVKTGRNDEEPSGTVGELATTAPDQGWLMSPLPMKLTLVKAPSAAGPRN